MTRKVTPRIIWTAPVIVGIAIRVATLMTGNVTAITAIIGINAYLGL
jgi:hypothetical protein